MPEVLETIDGQTLAGKVLGQPAKLSVAEILINKEER
jgi:hypothetical protein